MRIIVSPAKQMKRADDIVAPVTVPVLLDRTEELLEWLRSRSTEVDHVFVREG